MHELVVSATWPGSLRDLIGPKRRPSFWCRIPDERPDEGSLSLARWSLASIFLVAKDSYLWKPSSPTEIGQVDSVTLKHPQVKTELPDIMGLLIARRVPTPYLLPKMSDPRPSTLRPPTSTVLWGSQSLPVLWFFIPTVASVSCISNSKPRSSRP